MLRDQFVHQKINSSASCINKQRAFKILHNLRKYCQPSTQSTILAIFSFSFLWTKICFFHFHCK